MSVVRAFDHRQKNLMCSENIEHTQKDHIDDSCLKNSVKQVKKVTSLIDLLPFIPQLFFDHLHDKKSIYRFSQCARTDLNIRFLSKPMTTTV